MFGKTNRETCLNFGMSEGKVKKKKKSNPLCLVLTETSSKIPLKSWSQETVTWKLPTLPFGVIACTFYAFFSDQSQNNYKLTMKSYMKLHMSLKDSFPATLALKH